MSYKCGGVFSSFLNVCRNVHLTCSKVIFGVARLAVIFRRFSVSRVQNVSRERVAPRRGVVRF